KMGREMYDIKQKAPIGIKILGSFGIVVSMILLISLISYNTMYKQLFSITKNVVIFSYILLLFISFVGIMLLKNWARMLLLVILSIKLGGSVIALINYAISDVSKLKMIHLLEQCTNIIIFLPIIYYLCKKSIITQFRKK
ncbi:MAG: hypothetical protein KKI13_02680, partial [Candidatus Omnitrophica bacterium]|nr:hypothetical protein [Candidatus Omnitrophota bacterium]MCG2705158.1 hypothetical protein [Candidatus Omnitrophota bacterium]